MLRLKYWLLINMQIKLLPYWIKWLGHTFLCAFFIVLAFTLADFIKLPLKSFGDVTIVIGYMMLVLGACWTVFIILSLLTTIPFMIGYGLIVLLSAILAFYAYTIDFSFNTMILDIVFQNDLTLSAEMITWDFLVWVICATVMGVVLAFMRKFYVIDFSNRITYIILINTLVCLVIFLSPISPLTRPLTERIPFNLYSVTKQYIIEHHAIMKQRPRNAHIIKPHTDDNLTVVVVLGEALRPQNMSINGYYRNTTPYLEELQVVFFSQVFSRYPYTNRSIPQILTRADSTHTHYAYTERSFIDVFKMAGFKTNFISNQETELPYVYFTKEADKHIQVKTKKIVYNFEKWLDEDILPHYFNILNAEQTKSLIVLHCIGSHWWYNAHYPDNFEYFKPVMKSKVFSDCDSMEIVNSYDNTVLYTDYFLKQVIEVLKNRHAIVLFLSDHGEALGENGQWLHASTSQVTHHTAAFIWMSDLYKHAYPANVTHCNDNKNKNYSTDYFFHSVIDAADIKTDVLDTTLSIFR